MSRAIYRNFDIVLTVLFLTLVVPSVALAWGPMTHVYLGSEILYLGALLPVAMRRLLKKYRQDFLYGNLMADTILGKKYQKKDRNSHSWNVGFALLNSAESDAERAFCYGYLAHLAADTVAHGTYTAGKKNFRHAILEMQADSIIHTDYWLMALAIDKKVQVHHDDFLERSLDRVIFSFNVNKGLYKSAVLFSCLNPQMIVNSMGIVATRKVKRTRLETFQRESIARIVDVLTHGEQSSIVSMDPMENIKRGRVLKAFLN